MNKISTGEFVGIHDPHERTMQLDGHSLPNNFWPAPEAFLDLQTIQQITDGRARCTAIAICNEAGLPLRQFVQGQAAHFFYEFELLETIGLPSGGLEFHDELGYVVHGKNSFQYGSPAPEIVLPGQRLRYHHVITLDVFPGDYWFTVGLASTDAQTYRDYKDGPLTHQQFDEQVREHCRAVNAGMFTVWVGPSGKLHHHGIANLPGDSQVVVIESNTDFAPPTRVPSAPQPPTIVHVTHWKAGSQWVLKILSECVPELVVAPQQGETQFLHWPIQTGKVYPTVYVTKHQYDSVALPPNTRRFVIIRDLRDTLVSAYFSFKQVHPLIENSLARIRAVLQSVSMEEGLIYLMNGWLPACAEIQSSWLQVNERLIHYEDLLNNDVEIFERTLIGDCNLPVTSARLHQAVLSNRFENITQGRLRGTSDETAHERKGVAGDWRNYFSERVKTIFKASYGGLLVATSYEHDLNW